MTRLHTMLSVSLCAVLLAACPETPAARVPAESAATAEGVAQAAENGSDDVVVEIAPGESHTVFLTADGTVWTCGNGGDGQLGWEQTEECFWGVPVEGLPSVAAVAAGTAFSVFLAEDGSLWGAGYGFDERLGPTASERFSRPVELGIEGLSEVAASTNYTLALRSDGGVVAFGVNDAGGLGHGSPEASATPVETGVEALAIATGGGYSLALTADGRCCPGA